MSGPYGESPRRVDRLRHDGLLQAGGLLVALTFVLYVFGCAFPLFAPPQTTRVDVSSAEAEANGGGSDPSISAHGRYVAFGSAASNLVTGDTNGKTDVFVRDRQTGQTTRVSISSNGAEANADSTTCCISGDGRYVTFQSQATNLVAGDVNGKQDVFVHDRQTGQTTRVSVSSAGTEADDDTYVASLSSDGRYVAFLSYASNLVTGDTNQKFDVFVHDRQTGQTTRVSVSSAGAEANGNSANASLSADGRYVAFGSRATNLVVGDTNGKNDIFVRDRQTSQTTRVSVSSAATEAGDDSYSPIISADGRYVAFESRATNLVTGDTNGEEDIFVRDRQTGQTTRVSISSNGAEANAESTTCSISGDGRYAAFQSPATNLVADDVNGKQDIFVHDRQTGQTTRVSVSTEGTEANDESEEPDVSADGRYVAFMSVATNLVPGDTNGTNDIFVHDRGP